MDNRLLKWSVHLPNLLFELVTNNPTAWAMAMPVKILRILLAELSARAIELDDPKLNILMIRLSLYELEERERMSAIEQQLARIDNGR